VDVTGLRRSGGRKRRGGRGLNLLIDSGSARNVYTYAGSANKTLTHADNAFLSTNELITNTLLGVDASQRQALFDTVREGGFGDIIHSEPAVVAYLGPGRPAGHRRRQDRDLRGRQRRAAALLRRRHRAGALELRAAGAPKPTEAIERRRPRLLRRRLAGRLLRERNQKILVVGSRGAGSPTQPWTLQLQLPVYLYSFGPKISWGPRPAIMNAWASPGVGRKVVVATGSTVTTDGCNVNVSVSTADALLFGGGYDNNQDLLPPSPADSVGRAVFGVDTVTGALINGLKFSPATHPSLGMTHSVVDVSGFDHDGDGIVSRIYFGDLGGKVFSP
jgi:hypothetical protein